MKNEDVNWKINAFGIAMILFFLIFLFSGYMTSTHLQKQIDNLPKRICHIEEKTHKLIVTTSTNDGRSFPIHKYNKNNEIDCEDGVKFQDWSEYSAVYNPTSEPKICLITIEKEICEVK